MPVSAPHGRTEVVESLLVAATDLFAKQGPRATSVREIAVAARVNHGLVHHYFGSKHALLTACLDRLAARHAAVPVDDEEAASDDLDLHWRVLARALLDGEDPRALQRSYPLIDQLVADARERGLSLGEAKWAAADTVALQLGRRMFGGFLAAALGLNAVSDDETAARPRGSRRRRP